MNRRPESILEYCGESGPNSCGYCHNKDKSKYNTAGEVSDGDSGEVVNNDDEDKGNSISFGVWAAIISNSDYLHLLDRGWRRSGKYLYKPQNEKTCCPQYTIRLDVTKFYLSRSQKRVLRQMNEYLATGKKPRSSVKDSVGDDDVVQTINEKVAKSEETGSSKKDPDRVMQKKKEIRRRRFEENCKKRGIDIDEFKKKRMEKEEARRRTIESYTNEAKQDWKHKLTLKVVSVNSEEGKSRMEESFQLYKKYQQTVHGDKENKFASYKRFLCDSPLENDKNQSGRMEMGSFHIWFLLDDELIAVSVIDILPRCLSGKYMYYNPDYSFLSLGTFTALKEIELTRKILQTNPEFRYYYMGYYIHSCPKMRYKAKFRPSDLLCDKTFEWVEFDKCKKMLDESTEPNGYTIFRRDIDVKPAPLPIENRLVFANQRIVPYIMYRHLNPDYVETEEFRSKFQRLINMIGPNLPNVLYYFSELN